MGPETLIIEYLTDTPEDQSVIRLRGPLTMQNVAQFQSAVRAGSAPRMILDLSQVPYVDSAGLGSIVGAQVSLHKAGRWLALTGVNERVKRLFEITRVNSIFLTFPTLGDAMSAMSGQADA
ncbi:MAG TPA: STAS domain-containing protein [Terriglobales bacterium]|nr:STAS domain-containing protein [Terriglobales bacterium]